MPKITAQVPQLLAYCLANLVRTCSSLFDDRQKILSRSLPIRSRFRRAFGAIGMKRIDNSFICIGLRFFQEALSNDIDGLCDFNVISWQAYIRTGDGADHTFSGKLLG
jgi:hypothetical protein